MQRLIGIAPCQIRVGGFPPNNTVQSVSHLPLRLAGALRPVLLAGRFFRSHP